MYSITVIDIVSLLGIILFAGFVILRVGLFPDRRQCHLQNNIIEAVCPQCLFFSVITGVT